MLIDAGRVATASILGNYSPGTGISLGAYVNPVTWTRATKYTDLTEGTWLGYARRTAVPVGIGSLIAPGYGFQLFHPPPLFNVGMPDVLIYGLMWSYSTDITVSMSGGFAYPTPILLRTGEAIRHDVGLVVSVVQGP